MDTLSSNDPSFNRTTRLPILRDDGTKQCSKCKQWKPATTEYFAKNAQQKTRLHPCCKQCFNEVRYRRNPNIKPSDRSPKSYQGNTKIILPDGTTQCTRCKVFKPATTEFFYAHPHTVTKLDPRCKQCRQETAICLNPKPMETVRTCTKCHQAKPATVEFFAEDKRRKDHMQTICRVCINAHKHQYKIDHPDQESAWAKDRRVKNPQAHRTHNRNRKALLRNASGTHTKEDIEKQYKAQKGKCYWCKDKLGKDYHVDHYIPLSRGGSNDPSNLVLACPFCNISRRNRLPNEWSRYARLF